MMQNVQFAGLRDRYEAAKAKAVEKAAELQGKATEKAAELRERAETTELGRRVGAQLDEVLGKVQTLRGKRADQAEAPEAEAPKTDAPEPKDGAAE